MANDRNIQHFQLSDWVFWWVYHRGYWHSDNGVTVFCHPEVVQVISGATCFLDSRVITLGVLVDEDKHPDVCEALRELQQLKRADG